MIKFLPSGLHRFFTYNLLPALVTGHIYWVINEQDLLGHIYPVINEQYLLGHIYQVVNEQDLMKWSLRRSVISPTTSKNIKFTKFSLI